MANPVKSTDKSSGLWIGIAAAIAVAAGLALYLNSGAPPATPTGAGTETPAAPSQAAPATGAATEGAAGTAATPASTTAPEAPAAAATTETAAAATGTEAPKPEFPPEELNAPGPLPEVVVGEASAPITIVEYASTTCPHCAAFHKEVLPGLKEKYLDTSKAKLYYREFPRDNLDAAVYMLARCLEPAKYMPFVGVMFENQEKWAFAEGDPLPRLLEFAKQAGFSEESFKACLGDEKQLGKLGEARNRAVQTFKVNSTPTVFVNGVRFEGSTLKELEDLIAKVAAK